MSLRGLGQDPLSSLQVDEMSALTGDRSATLRVVSGLRRYRAVIVRMRDATYSDGAIDGATLAQFMAQVDDIEGDE